MAKSFLEIAEIILMGSKKPLKPDEIYQIAVSKLIIISKGKTPVDSLRARLSEELRINGFDSKFMRVGPNRWALREWGLKEHIAQPFKRKIPKEVITCVNREDFEFFEDKFGFNQEPNQLLEFLSNVKLTPIVRKDAENDTDYKQLISYVLLEDHNNNILTYRRGSYSSAHKMLKGSACLGFGGHVQDMDTQKLFNRGYGGIYDTADREVSEELKGTVPENLQVLGYINDDSSPEGVKHFGAVLKGKLPKSFRIKDADKELSINGLKLMSPNELWEHFYEFEFWSQLLIRHFYYDYQPVNPVIIKPTKINVLSNILVFVGEIATGKTIICEMLAQKLGYNYVSTRKCVANLIEMKDFGTKDRTKFQKRAESFIKQKTGPSKLAKEIKKHIHHDDNVNIIDGIRHLDTIKELRKIYPDLILIYIDSTRDDAYRNFSVRSNGMAHISQFRSERFHPVEREIQLIKDEESDAYIFNGGNREQLFEAFINWYNLNSNERRRL